MPDKIRTTSSAALGPWLLNAESLKELDKLVDEEWGRLMDLRKQRIEEVAEKELKVWLDYDRVEKVTKKDRESKQDTIRAKVSERYGYEATRSLTLHLHGNERIELTCFADALRHPSCAGESPMGFTLKLRCMEVRCSVEVPRIGLLGPTLQIEATPDTSQMAQEMYTVFQSWRDSNSPTKLQQIWRSFAEHRWLLIPLTAFLMLVFLGAKQTTGRHEYQLEALKMVKEGISQDEVPKALELLLCLEANLVPKSANILSNPSSWFLPISILLIMSLTSIAPNAVLGIGKGEAAIKRWRSWAKLLLVIAPTWIFGTFLEPKIRQFIESMF